MVRRLRYAVVIERAAGNFSAYVPDLPGCVSTGATVEEAERNIREAIEFHLRGLREDGVEPPPPSTRCAYVEAESGGDSERPEQTAAEEVGTAAGAEAGGAGRHPMTGMRWMMVGVSAVIGYIAIWVLARVIGFFVTGDLYWWAAEGLEAFWGWLSALALITAFVNAWLTYRYYRRRPPKGLLSA